MGKGQYGQVYKAHEIDNPSNLVALKLIDIEPEKDTGFHITALREIMNLRKINHPNVIKLIEVSTNRKLEEKYL